jgi:hypothetical protein
MPALPPAIETVNLIRLDTIATSQRQISNIDVRISIKIYKMIERSDSNSPESLDFNDSKVPIGSLMVCD